jgi:alpha-1,2-mannosyltransferase
VAPFWFTPHAAGPREYGFHWLTTLVANCFLLAGVAFGGYMALTQLRRQQRAQGQAEDLDPVAGMRAR